MSSGDLNSSSLLNNHTGNGQTTQNQSASAFGFAILLGVGIALAQIAVFALLKDRLPKIYQPKSFLVSERQRTPPLPPGPWQWVLPTFKISNDDLLQKCGLDAFFLCRYLILMMKILLPPALIILPVLLPINALGGNDNPVNIKPPQNVTKGLDILTMSNVQAKYYDRLWAHILFAVALVTWICYVIVVELKYFIKVRQTYLTSPQHRLRASASTVLVQGLPKKYVDNDMLAELFDVYPGGIRNIWINRDYSELSKLVDERADVHKNLEGAESELITKCWKIHMQRMKDTEHPKKKKKSKDDGGPPQFDGSPENDLDPQASSGSGLSFNNPGQVHHSVDEAVQAINRGDDVAEPEMETKKNILGQGFNALTHGVQNIGRGIGQGIGTIGRGIKGRRSRGDSSNGDSSRFGLGRIISRKEKRGEHLNDVEEDNHQSQELERSNTEGFDDQRSHTSVKSSELPFDLFYDEDSHLEARWREFIEVKDRPTMKVSTRWKWCPAFLNPRATKVDTIYYCRKELARLNKLIEERQRPEYERFYPKMNSAFIQLNNQAAAHMVCQSVAHQTPTFMTPRSVEISPNDVIWGNLSIPGWQRYIRKGIIFMLCVGLMILWTPLITVFSSIAQLNTLRQTVSWLSWMKNWNTTLVSLIQSILPIALVGLFVYLVGLILRVLVKYGGAPTHMQVELSVQKYYFVLSFLQYFVVVSIANAISVIFGQLKDAIDGKFNPLTIPRLLAQNIPKASNYFLQNIVVQSFSQSAGGLLQILPLLLLVISIIGNPVARSKFSDRTKLQTINWGTQYAQYTTLACIAIIYSVISPLILPFTIIGFGVWWVSTRYQMLYIYQYTIDTGGLLFPTAVKQLFVGVYTMELVLIGFFVIVAAGAPGGSIRWGIPYAIILVVLTVATIVFQQVIRISFGELWRYLPITLEDDAVKGDEEFAQLMAQRHSKEDEKEMMKGAAQGGPEDHDDDDGQGEDAVRDSDLEAQKRNSRIADPENIDTEMSAPAQVDGEFDDSQPDAPKKRLTMRKLDPRNLLPNNQKQRNSWAERGKRSSMYSRGSSSQHTATLSHPVPAGPVQDRLETVATEIETVPNAQTQDNSQSPIRQQVGSPFNAQRLPNIVPIAAAGELLSKAISKPVGFINPNKEAAKAQHQAFAQEADDLYGNIPDDLEDLTVDERDALLSRAFMHEALRAKRPCVWLPRDQLGVSDDEVRNTARFSDYIWVSNEKQGINEKGRCFYTGPPPDFDQVDLIQL
jgi:calcium permeable stress-gated cation channel